jgi:hypothetical protein
MIMLENVQILESCFDNFRLERFIKDEKIIIPS